MSGTVGTAPSLGPRELRRDILDPGLCSSCGLCAGFCPYIKCLDGRVAIVYDCGLQDGRCYRACPQTFTDPAALDRYVFGRVRRDAVLGEYLAVLSVRVAEACASRYAGALTLLASLSLAEGAAEAAVLAQSGADGRPEPVVATTEEQVRAAGGGRYGACPTLMALNPLLVGGGRVAVVGRSCQILALRKLEMLGADGAAEKVGIAVGLFCFGNPSFSSFRVAERPHIMPACNICFDVTAELADISLSSGDAGARWNTLIVRTPRGQALVERARSAGMLDTERLGPEMERSLRRSVEAKKRRVLDALEGRGLAGELAGRSSGETGRGHGHLWLEQDQVPAAEGGGSDAG